MRRGCRRAILLQCYKQIELQKCYLTSLPCCLRLSCAPTSVKMGKILITRQLVFATLPLCDHGAHRRNTNKTRVSFYLMKPKYTFYGDSSRFSSSSVCAYLWAQYKFALAVGELSSELSGIVKWKSSQIEYWKVLTVAWKRRGKILGRKIKLFYDFLHFTVRSPVWMVTAQYIQHTYTAYCGDNLN